jgi:hypothetical protein
MLPARRFPARGAAAPWFSDRHRPSRARSALARAPHSYTIPLNATRTNSRPTGTAGEIPPPSADAAAIDLVRRGTRVDRRRRALAHSEPRGPAGLARGARERESVAIGGAATLPAPAEDEHRNRDAARTSDTTGLRRRGVALGVARAASVRAGGSEHSAVRGLRASGCHGGRRNRDGVGARRGARIPAHDLCDVGASPAKE